MRGTSVTLRSTDAPYAQRCVKESMRICVTIPIVLVLVFCGGCQSDTGARAKEKADSLSSISVDTISGETIDVL